MEIDEQDDVARQDGAAGKEGGGGGYSMMRASRIDVRISMTSSSLSVFRPRSSLNSSPTVSTSRSKYCVGNDTKRAVFTSSSCARLLDSMSRMPMPGVSSIETSKPRP